MATKVKQTILAVAIAIVFVLFIGHSIHYFYEKPRLDNFCNNISRTIPTDSCGGHIEPTKDNFCYCEPGIKNQTRCYKSNPEFIKCESEYQKAVEKYERNVFIITTIIGIVIILIAAVLNLVSVSAGLMGGGSLTIIYGVIRYWGNAGDLLRVIVLGLALVFLIWLGYTKLNPKKKR